MKTSSLVLFVVSDCLALTSTAFATPPAPNPDPTITVFATMAPNVGGSPSFAPWAANGLTAMEDGLTSFGAAGPTQFNVATTPLPVATNFVTGFPSWMGQADPSSPYNDELGTRADFVAVINGNGGLISIANMGVTLSSSDPGDALGVSWPDNNLSSLDWTYDADDIGILFNNGVNMSGGFTIIDSSTLGYDDGTALVNEIISIGAGNAYAGYLGDDPNPGATDQDIINYDLSFIDPYDFTGTFTYGDPKSDGIYVDSGSATFDFTSVPDAASALGLLGLALSGLALLRRKLI